MFIRLLIYLVIGVIIYRIAKGLMRAGTGGRQKMAGHAPEQVDDVMIKDPVCGVYFPRRKGVPLIDNGQQLHFCSEACRDQYQANKKDGK